MSNDQSAGSFYTQSQRALQDEFGRRPLADRLELAIVEDHLDEHQSSFIASRDFFFLSTVTAAGEPTVSFKGGGAGLVTVQDERSLLFPIYDGNGMYLSAGNVSETGKVGLLFIDFETPQRLRVQGDAVITRDDVGLMTYPGAELGCQVSITSVFVNCARYIHPHTRVGTSAYVPSPDGDQPLPSWKQIDGLQDVLSDTETAAVQAAGGPITQEDYTARLLAGES